MKIEISQEQRQIISPALIQTLELVMLPSLELKEKIEEEAKVNPALILEKKKKNQKKSYLKHKGSGSFDNQAFLENLSVYDFNLYKYMMEQVRDQLFSDREKQIAEIILSSLNENGLLQKVDEKGQVNTLPAESVIENSDITLKEFEEVRKKIQKLEPIGVASYSSHEYLLIQSEEKFGGKSLEYRILNECRDFLEKKLYSKIAKDLGVNYDKIEKAIENISKLNLVPASQFSMGIPQYIIPDAFVSVNENGIQLTLNDEYIPDIRLNKHCLELYSGDIYKGKKTILDKEDKQFLRENIEKAKILD